MWFCTDRGLVRYGGQKFEVYDRSNGLLNSVVFNCFEERPDRIWVNDIANSLCYFNPLQYPIRFYPYPYNDSLHEAFGRFGGSEFIRNIWHDGSGSIHITLLRGTGKVVVDNKGNWEIKNRILFTQERHAAHFDQDLRINLNREEGEFTLFSEFVPPGESPGDIIVSSNGVEIDTDKDKDYSFVVHSMYGVSDFETRKDTVYFIVGKYLFKYVDSEVNVIELGSEALKITLAETGEIYVTTYYGCYVLDSNLNIRELLLPNQRSTDAFFDNEGGLWIATAENGIYYIAGKRAKVVDNRQDEEMIFYYIEVDSQYIFGSSWGGYMQIIDRVSGDHKRIDQTTTYGGIVRTFSENSLRQYFGHEYLNLFEEDKDLNRKIYRLRGKLLGQSDYFSLSRRICSFSQPREKYAHVLGIDVRGNVETKEGEVLLTSDKGLMKLNEDLSVQPFQPDVPVFRENNEFISRFRDGIVGNSVDKGVFYYENDKIFMLTEANGLTNRQLTDLVVKNDSVIWVSYYGGIDKISVGEEITDVSIDRISITNNLPSEEVLSMDVRNDTVWIATKRGLVCFDGTDSLFRSTLLHENFHFDSIQINNKENSKYDQFISLGEYDRLDLYFTQASYASNKQLFYEYKIPGLTAGWESTNGNQLTLSNLPSGEYELFVRAYIPKVETGSHLKLGLNVVPVFWKTTEAIILYIIFLFLIMTLVYQFAKYRTVKNQHAELEKVKLELKALVSQMNPHFTFNTINSVQHYIMRQDKKTALTYLADFAVLMRESLDFSRNEIVNLEDEINFLKKYVELENKRFDSAVELKVELDLISNIDSVMLPALLLHPIVENAIIHGLQDVDYLGIIRLQIKESRKAIYITIEDNGRGQNQSLKNKYHSGKSHGVDILKRRVKLYNGKDYREDDVQIVFSDKPQGGTTVRIRLDKLQMLSHFNQD